MIWKILIPISLVALVMSAGLYFLTDYLALNAPYQFAQNMSSNRSTTPTNQPPNSTTTDNTAESVELIRVMVADNLFVPWSIVWTSPDRLLFSERNGSIRAIVNDQLQPDSLIDFPEVVKSGEQGLMGLAVDPDYQDNKYLYAARSKRINNTFQVDVLRLVDNQDSISLDRVIIEALPAAQNHAGMRLGFGPDQKLYVTTGDTLERSLAQDRSSLAGKILRYNNDGTIPSDNPISGSPVWSLGHRNAQGLAWDSRNGNLWSTEHGPSGFDGPGGGDEVNLIQKGANYGWPTVSHESSQAGLVSPVQVFTPAVAPASLAFYDHQAIPQYQNNLFFGALRGQAIVRLTLNIQDPTQISSFEKIELGNGLGRIREVAVNPSGEIYFSTSNQDGRGQARAADDKIYKITPR